MYEPFYTVPSGFLLFAPVETHALPKKKKNPARRSKVSCVWRGMKLRRGFVGESQIERAKEPGIFHGNFPY